MTVRLLTALAVVWLAVTGSTTDAAAPAFQEGVKIEADGKPIDIEVGHLVPCVVDWNSDGKKDLIVGQFFGGRIRLYLNRGADGAPLFTDFTYLRAGGEEISLPFG